MSQTISFTRAEVDALQSWINDPIKKYRLVKLLRLFLEQMIDKDKKAKAEKKRLASIAEIKNNLT